MMTVSNTRNPCHCETVEESDPSSNFDCSICLDTPQDPVVTKCGHLFCWPCLHQWITIHSISEECPVCKACVKDNIIPLYGRGKVGLTILDSNIPQRPSAQRSYVAAASMPLAAGFEHHQSHGNRRGLSSCSAAAFSIFPALFGYRIIPLPEYSSGLSSGAVYNGLPAMTSERRPLSAKREFVLYWFLILLACFASLCFLLF